MTIYVTLNKWLKRLDVIEAIGWLLGLTKSWHDMACHSSTCHAEIITIASSLLEGIYGILWKWKGEKG